MTVEINFIPESVLLWYNHPAAPLTRARSYCHHFPFQSSQVIPPLQAPVYVHIKTGFTISNGSVDCLFTESGVEDGRRRESTPKANGREYYSSSHSFFASSCLSLFCCSLTPSSLLPFFHSALDCYLSCHPSSPEPTRSSHKRSVQFNSQRRRNRQANSNERTEQCNNKNERTEVWQIQGAEH